MYAESYVYFHDDCGQLREIAELLPWNLSGHLRPHLRRPCHCGSGRTLTAKVWRDPPQERSSNSKATRRRPI
jgi:hypothetical protein